MAHLNLKAVITAAALTAAPVAALADSHELGWAPEGPINMMIAFQAGGGADSLARLLAEELNTRYGWEVIPENVTGRGGSAMIEALLERPADGTAVGITVSEAFTYNIQVAQNPAYALDDLDYISTLTGSQMGIIAQASRGWTSLADVVAAAEAGETLTFAAMSDKLVDATYVIGQTLGVDFTSVRVRGGRGGLNAVVAEDVDLAWAAGVQTPGVMAGDIINLVSAEEGALRVSPEAQLLSDYDIPFTFGVKFMVVAPAGLPAEAHDAWMMAVASILNDPESQIATLASRAFSGPEVVQGDDLRAMIDQGYLDAGALLDASAE